MIHRLYLVLLIFAANASTDEMGLSEGPSRKLQGEVTVSRDWVILDLTNPTPFPVEFHPNADDLRNPSPQGV